MKGCKPTPLATAAARVERSIEKLELLADTGGDADFGAATAEWFEDLKALGREIERVTGLTAPQIAEILSK